MREAATERIQSSGKAKMTPASLPAPRLLVADDQRDVIEALRLLLKPEGYELGAVSSPAGVLEALQKQEFDAALIDLNYTRDTTSGQEGLDLLQVDIPEIGRHSAYFLKSGSLLPIFRLYRNRPPQ